VAAGARALKAVAIDLAALGDTEPLWRDWLEDASRRFRVDVTALDDELPNWRQLLERFAEERAPVYFRRDADVSSTIRRLEAAGTRIGVFTDAPEELARVALSHLGALQRVEALETGADAQKRVLRRLGDGATVVRTREELLGLT
jgi:phosphoglycolate phosphatase-like HAD superfamily hydrolase